ncbi:unnamed protein product [Rotaria magnacalcarata]|nr:unnamed protein product [Rotaria magnacalcarata]CAF4054473.1 unnamed protein product [Rotaria magnacalcarata]
MHPTAMDINVQITMKNFMSSTPRKDLPSPILSTDYLYKKDSKKTYTLQQIFDNVESIQKQYEQIMDTKMASSCFFSLKQIIKNFNFLRHKTNQQLQNSNSIEYKSPFIFGGETLQWIALPQSDDHIYENDLIH